MQSFRIAAVSMRSVPAAPEKNLPRVAEWVMKARQQGAALVCFPELAVTGYLAAPEIWHASEPVPGPVADRLVELARETGVCIAAGIAERDRSDLVYNTYVLAGPQGYLGKSRKVHIPPVEAGCWRGGGVPPVIDIGAARVGVNICFDNFLPESARLVALQGAEVILAPYVWSVGDWGDPPDHARRNRAWKEYACRTFPARAIDNGVFHIAINACGSVRQGGQIYHGNPIVLMHDPLGRLIAESPDEAGDEVMIVADLDARLLGERRSQDVFHPRFRRPELYGLLAQGDIGPQEIR